MYLMVSMMTIKRIGSTIYGASLSSVEKKAMDMEIRRQLAEYDRKHKLEIQALVLWQLHEQLGFGKKRLREFYDNFDLSFDSLIERYELQESDTSWLCTLQLKELGIDIESWEEEKIKQA